MRNKTGPKPVQNNVASASSTLSDGFGNHHLKWRITAPHGGGLPGFHVVSSLARGGKGGRRFGGGVRLRPWGAGTVRWWELSMVADNRWVWHRVEDHGMPLEPAAPAASCRWVFYDALACSSTCDPEQSWKVKILLAVSLVSGSSLLAEAHS